MSGGNHAAGGLVFTGIMASLWNVNIFYSVDYTVFCVFCALLPDVDHTKSPVGKLFYPLARWIDRKYGHRTITHSLAFLIVVTLLSAFIEGVYSSSHPYTVILFFAVFSHIILDMITLQGVPFFYPFARNPCVLPGNPRMRVRTGDRRAELMVFSLCILLGVSCFNLFKNGFWTSYNRAFGTTKHVYAENQSTDKLLTVDYQYNKNGKEYSGRGFLLDANKEETVLFDKKVFTLSKKDNTIKIKSLKPAKTEYAKELKEISFYTISCDSLQQLIQNKVVSGQIQSSKAVQVTENNITKQTQIIKLERAYNPLLGVAKDTAAERTQETIKKLKIKLKEQREKHYSRLGEVKKLVSEYRKTESKVKETSDLYNKNKLQNKLIELRRKIEQSESSIGIYKPDPILKFELQIAENELKEIQLFFSGFLTFPILPKD